MKAVVHIGTEKTGTSSIQAFLDANRDALISHGFYFVSSMGATNNRDLPSYCLRTARDDDFFRDRGIAGADQRREFRENARARFLAEIDAVPASVHTVLISSEHFHSRVVHPDEIETLRDLLAERFDDVSILVYIRNQVDTCLSSYSTMVKAGGTERLPEFLAKVDPARHYYNYDFFIGKWERVFGKESITVRLFDRSEFVNNDLLDDFVDCFDAGMIGALHKDIDVRNESLTYMGQILGRAVNLVLPRYIDGTVVNEERRAAMAYVTANFKGAGESIPDDMRTAIMNSFAESNQRLRDRYFPGRDELFPRRQSRQATQLIPDDLDEKIAGLIEQCSRH